jgi:hypothetical protein
MVVVPHGFREKSRWLQKPMGTEQWKMALEAFSYSLLFRKRKLRGEKFRTNENGSFANGCPKEPAQGAYWSQLELPLYVPRKPAGAG